MHRLLWAALALACVVFSAVPAQAKHRHHRHHHHVKRVVIAKAAPVCPVFWGCEDVARLSHVKAGISRVSETAVSQIVSHPTGCPARAFCGCGASIRVFGRSVRELWLAANWFKFPRAAPNVGMVAVRRHHVFVLEAHLKGDVWSVYDANSGHGATRIHPRSIAGYTIVNPVRA